MSDWRTVEEDADGDPLIQVCELDFQRATWKETGKSYRVIAVRRRDRDTGKQVQLWEHLDYTAGLPTGVDECRKAVRYAHKHGAGVIKIMSTGGVLSANDALDARSFSDAELAAIVDEAKLLGLKVCCHAHGAAGIKAAVRAGVASIEHGTFLDDEAIRMMIDHGTYLTTYSHNQAALEDLHLYLQLGSPQAKPDQNTLRAISLIHAQKLPLKQSRRLSRRWRVRVHVGRDTRLAQQTHRLLCHDRRHGRADLPLLVIGGTPLQAAERFRTQAPVKFYVRR